MSSKPLADLIYVLRGRLVDLIYSYLEQNGLIDEIRRRWNIYQVKSSLNNVASNALNDVAAALTAVMSSDAAYSGLYAFMDELYGASIESIFPKLKDSISSRDRLRQYLAKTIENRITKMTDEDIERHISQYISRAVSGFSTMKMQDRCNALMTIIDASVNPALSAVRTEAQSALVYLFSRTSTDILTECIRTWELGGTTLKAKAHALGSAISMIISSVTQPDVYSKIPINRIAEVVARLVGDLDRLYRQAEKSPEFVSAPPRPSTAPAQRIADIVQECDGNECRTILNAMIDAVNKTASEPNRIYVLVRAFRDKHTSRSVISEGLRQIAADALSRHMINVDINNIYVDYQDDKIVITYSDYGISIYPNGNDVTVRGIIRGNETRSEAVVRDLGYLFVNRDRFSIISMPHVEIFINALGNISVNNTVARLTRQARAQLTEVAISRLLNEISNEVDALMYNGAEVGRVEGISAVPYPVIRLTDSAVLVPSSLVGRMVTCSDKRRAEISGARINSALGIACAVPGMIITAEKPGGYISASEAVNIAYHMRSGSPEYSKYSDRVYDVVLTYMVISIPNTQLIYIGYNINSSSKRLDILNEFVNTQYIDVSSSGGGIYDQILNNIAAWPGRESVGTFDRLVSSLLSFVRVLPHLPIPRTIMQFPTERELAELGELETVAMASSLRPSLREVMSSAERLAYWQNRIEDLLEEMHLDRQFYGHPREESFEQYKRALRQLRRAARGFMAVHARPLIPSALSQLIDIYSELPVPEPLSAQVVRGLGPVMDTVESDIKSRFQSLVSVTGYRSASDAIEAFRHMLASLMRLADMCGEVYREYQNSKLSNPPARPQHPYVVGLAEFICSISPDMFANPERIATSNWLRQFMDYISTLKDRLTTSEAKTYAGALLGIYNYIINSGDVRAADLTTNLVRLMYLLSQVKSQFCICWS
jgi:uncharacterized protein YqgV (UPF0045/DUF77 family)